MHLQGKSRKFRKLPSKDECHRPLLQVLDTLSTLIETCQQNVKETDCRIPSENLSYMHAAHTMSKATLHDNRGNKGPRNHAT